MLHVRANQSLLLCWKANLCSLPENETDAERCSHLLVCHRPAAPRLCMHHTNECPKHCTGNLCHQLSGDCLSRSIAQTEMRDNIKSLQSADPAKSTQMTSHSGKLCAGSTNHSSSSRILVTQLEQIVKAT